MRTVYGVIFLGMICGILSSSCEDTAYTDVTREDFIYLNNSSHPVSMAYYAGGVKHQVEMEKNGSILQTGYTSTVELAHLIHADSVVITFDKQKQLTYTKSNLNDQSTDQHILDRKNYSLISFNRRYVQFTYIIDDHHFDKAK